MGENRAQDLQAKVAAHGELFAWDFIGAAAEPQVRLIVPHVRLIHSVASESALRELERHRELARRACGSWSRSTSPARPARRAIAPSELDAFIERSPCRSRG